MNGRFRGIADKGGFWLAMAMTQMTRGRHLLNRRIANGDQVSRLAGLAMKQKPLVDFSGYWRRNKETVA
jgi:hypothetical protein